MNYFSLSSFPFISFNIDKFVLSELVSYPRKLKTRDVGSTSNAHHLLLHLSFPVEKLAKTENSAWKLKARVSFHITTKQNTAMKFGKKYM